MHRRSHRSHTPWCNLRRSMLPDDDVHAAYALYLSKYIRAYTAAGVNVTMMTIQVLAVCAALPSV